jgi:hypothetical protein
MNRPCTSLTSKVCPCIQLSVSLTQLSWPPIYEKVSLYLVRVACIWKSKDAWALTQCLLQSFKMAKLWLRGGAGAKIGGFMLEFMK